MSDELRKFGERLRQNRAARARELTAAGAPATRPEDRIGATHAPGARVFDTITGEEGEVIGATRENIIVPTPER